MPGLVRKTILATAIAGSSIFLALGAQAHVGDHWRGAAMREALGMKPASLREASKPQEKKMEEKPTE
jgi:hypothetical protein